MLDNQSCRFFRGHAFFAGDEQCRFCTVVVCYHEYGIVPLRDGEFSNEIERNCFKGHSFMYGKYGQERGFRWSRIDFVSLAFCASLDIVRYVLSHIWPPVSPACQLVRLVNSRVAVSWCIMVCLYEKSSMFHFSGDHASSVLVPCPFYLLQSMCVNPWFEHFFILLIYGVRGFHFFLGNDSSHW